VASAARGNVYSGDARADDTVLVCRAGTHRVALPVPAVVEVHRAAAVTPLPGAPDAVIGVVDLRGSLVAVLDLRRRLGLDAPEPRPGDVLVAVRVHDRPLLLLTDAAADVTSLSPEQLQTADEVLPGARYVRDVARTADGPLVIHDLERFLSTDELLDLDRALADLEAGAAEGHDARAEEGHDARAAEGHDD
jgi:purine-binding chemotaxis protein CheW